MAPLVVLAMVATAVTAFFYLRIVVVMYFSDPASRAAGAGRRVGRGRSCRCGGRSAAGEQPRPPPVIADAPFVVVPGLLTVIVIAVAVIVTLGLGLFPGPVLDWLTVPLPLLS